MNDHQLEEMLWRAVEAPCGIEIESSDVETLKRKLYSVRAKLREKGNTSFDCLQFVTPPMGGELRIWLVNNTPKEEDGKHGSDKGEGGV